MRNALRILVSSALLGTTGLFCIQSVEAASTTRAGDRPVVRIGGMTPAKKVQSDAAGAKKVAAAAPQQAGASAPAGDGSFVLMCDTFVEQKEPDRLMEATANKALIDLGYKPLRMVYSNIDTTQSNGLVHVDKVIAYVKQVWGPNPSGHIMLDYEIPHMDRLAKGFSDLNNPEYKATLNSMVDAIKKLKVEFPNVKWTYYGIPGLPYYFPAQPWPLEWSLAPVEWRTAEVAKRNKALGPLLEAVDWISPTIYDQHEATKASSASQLTQTSKTYQDRITTLIKMGNEYLVSKGIAPKPVIPTINVFFAPGGNTLENRPIPTNEIVTDQVKTALDAGANGLAIWSAIDYYVRTAATGTYSNPNHCGQKKWRDFFRDLYLGGVEPSDWKAPAVREKLLKKVSEQVVVGATAVKTEVSARFPAASSAPAAQNRPQSANAKSTGQPASPNNSMRVRVLQRGNR
jgi:hypothetical protein